MQLRVSIPITSQQFIVLQQTAFRTDQSFHKKLGWNNRLLTEITIAIPTNTRTSFARLLRRVALLRILVEKATSFFLALILRLDIQERIQSILWYSDSQKLTIQEYPFLGLFVETTPRSDFPKHKLRSIGVSYDPQLSKSLTYHYKIASQANWRPINTFFSYHRIDRSTFLRKMWNGLHHGLWYEDMFMFVNFEVNSHCNRTCVYCPNKFFQRPLNAMRFETFKKVIDELGKMRYRGFIHYAFYGESLLDNRLKDFLAYAKHVCPQAQNHLNTNGDLLTIDRFKKLLNAGADFFFITLHDGVLTEKRKQFFIEAKKIDDRIDFSLPAHMKLNNRAGLVNVGPTNIFRSPCPLPSYDVEITCTGNVLPCCNDYFEKMKMGNVIDDSLQSIWRNKKFTTFRQNLKKGMRAKYEICKHCNMNVQHRSISASRVPSHA